MEILTVPTAAKIFGVTRMSMWRWVSSGMIPSFRTPGGHYRIRQDDIDKAKTESFTKGAAICQNQQ